MKITQIDIDRYRVDFITPDRKLRWINIDNQDFHSMGKQQLGEIIDSQV
jgi:very-short-patch-repair endonuclease